MSESQFSNVGRLEVPVSMHKSTYNSGIPVSTTNNHSAMNINSCACLHILSHCLISEQQIKEKNNKAVFN